ncbi:MAG: hypothetical protein KGH64_04165 [Candidatus Micrarchaeota archaeon]|nr:hypothetical protein [Candidatus Micrarchaeota archaeon]MDE1859306.1 hypothetical protein [Candidatus Micrarchaeota archaeon]
MKNERLKEIEKVFSNKETANLAKRLVTDIVDCPIGNIVYHDRDMIAQSLVDFALTTINQDKIVPVLEALLELDKTKIHPSAIETVVYGSTKSIEFMGPEEIRGFADNIKAYGSDEKLVKHIVKFYYDELRRCSAEQIEITNKVLLGYADSKLGTIVGLCEIIKRHVNSSQYQRLSEALLTSRAKTALNAFKAAPGYIPVMGESFYKLVSYSGEDSEFLESALLYYTALYLNCLDSPSIISSIHVRDRQFVTAAFAPRGMDKIDPATYLIADRLYKKSVVTIDELKTIFSSKKIAIERLDTHLSDIGIQDPKALSLQEKLVLIRASDDVDRILRQRELINEHLRIRNGGLESHNRSLEALAQSGFLVDRINKGYIGKVFLDHPIIEKDFVIEGLITGLFPQGSLKINKPLFYHNDSSQLYRRFGVVPEEFEQVKAEFAIAGARHAQEISALLNQKRYEDAIEVLVCALNGMGASAKHMTDKMATALGNYGKVSGQYVYLYTVPNKANILNISSKETSACCFLPGGAYSESALPYANDPGIVLVNFSVGRTIKKLRMADRQVHGVVISALGTSEGKRVAYIDSVEHGLIISNLTGRRERRMLLERLLRYYASLGAEELLLYANPHNTSAKEFVDSSELPVKDVPLRLLTDREQQLESLQAAKTEGITVRYKSLVRKDA